MKISLNWVKDFVEFDLPPGEVADRLTMAGLQVEALIEVGSGIDSVVAAEVISVDRHPGAEKLFVYTVWDGSARRTIVAGTDNARPGEKVALALPGTKLPAGSGEVIHEAVFSGVASAGMLCAADELGLEDRPPPEKRRLLVVPKTAKPGAMVADVLALRDTVLEIGVTPNRPDCLSHLGAAREIAVLLARPLRPPDPVFEETGPAVEKRAGVVISNPHNCCRYAGRVVDGARIGPSPAWLQVRLRAVGQRPINNVVDVTNYVLLELGHPLHAFDLDALAGPAVIVRQAAKGEKMRLLDGSEIALEADDIVIADAKAPVALAGVMGGLESEVTEGTRTLFIESAHFNPRTIRRTSKRYGISTEASYRFERGADVEMVDLASRRAAQLIRETAGGDICKGALDPYPKRFAPRTVSLRFRRLDGTLGCACPRERVFSILKGLGMKEVERTEEQASFEAPSFRVDVEKEIDLIEEVARVAGYDAIPETLFSVSKASDRGREEIKAPDTIGGLSRTLSAVMAGCGFCEALNYSFVSPDVTERLGLPEGDDRRNHVKISNPLGREQSLLRTSLVPGLLQNMAGNFRRGEQSIRLFEIGTAFFGRGDKLPEERTLVSAVMSGRRHAAHFGNPSDKVDFLDLKGVVDALLEALNAEDCAFAAAGFSAMLHPGHAAALSFQGRFVGEMGRVHPGVLSKFGIEEEVFAFELAHDALAAMWRPVRRFKQLSLHPPVRRDIAVVVDAGAPFEKVKEEIFAAGGEAVESADLFDLYRGKQVPAGKKSLAFSIALRQTTTVFDQEQINSIIKGIVERLSARFGAQLRKS